MKTFLDALKLINPLSRFLWPQQNLLRCYLCATLGVILINMTLQSVLPIMLKGVMVDLQYDTQNSLTVIKLLVYGLLWTMSHVKIEQITIIKPLQRGMHLFTEHLVLQNSHTNSGMFINALKLAQRGFNDLFWDLLLYFIPVVLQTISMITIFWLHYGLVHALLLSFVAIGYIIICAYGAAWTITTRKRYNAHDSNLMSHINETILSAEQKSPLYISTMIR